MKRMPAIAVLLILLAVPVFSQAAELQPYDARTFDALTVQGKPIVIAVHASWCPTCKVQEPIQRELMRMPEFRNYTLFVVDFDSNAAALKRFHVIKQSTMIVFKGKTEVGRSIGDTQRASLEALMLRARG
jgi:thioredoxin 1